MPASPADISLSSPVPLAWHLALCPPLPEFHHHHCDPQLQALDDFRSRIGKYEEVYETITDRELHYIKLIDM